MCWGQRMILAVCSHLGSLVHHCACQTSWPTNFWGSPISTSYLPVGALALQTYAINSGFMRMLGIWPRLFNSYIATAFPHWATSPAWWLLLPYLFVNQPLHYQDVQQANQLGQVTFCPKFLVGSTNGRLTSDLYPKQVFFWLSRESQLSTLTLSSSGFSADFAATWLWLVPEIVYKYWGLDVPP